MIIHILIIHTLKDHVAGYIVINSGYKVILVGNLIYKEKNALRLLSTITQPEKEVYFLND